MSASSTRPLSAPPSTLSISDGVTLKRSEKKRSGRARTGSVMCWSGSCGGRAPILARTSACPKLFRRGRRYRFYPPREGARTMAGARSLDAKWHLARGLIVLDDLVNPTQTVHQRRAGGQDVGAVDLVDVTMPDGAHLAPARARRDRRAVHRLAAPRRQDDLGIPARDLAQVDDALLRIAFAT